MDALDALDSWTRDKGERDQAIQRLRFYGAAPQARRHREAAMTATDRVVFINYRGEDNHSYGSLLHHELSRQFGENRVFLDSESIPAGADFVQELLGWVRSTGSAATLPRPSLPTSGSSRC